MIENNNFSLVIPIYNESINIKNLISEINRELIQQAGQDVMYMPRTLVKEDLIMGEDVLSKFTITYPIEMYIKTSDNFGGADDAISTFGLTITDELILTVHAERFKFVTGITTPKEGDLILFPSSLFHKTLPFSSNQERHVIAFDIIPE